MNALNQVRSLLEQQQKLNNERFNYVIPDSWDAYQLADSSQHLSDGTILVNPYEHLIQTIDAILDQAPAKHVNYLKPYYTNHQVETGFEEGNWIFKSIVYSMMIRTSSSFDHDRNYKLDQLNLYDLKDTGTFIKTIQILPFLKQLGIDTLYLLPISKYSLKDKKGEAGSPYGVANFFELDPNLKDPMTGPKSDVELEFQALVEACHMLQIKVVIDIIPRTNSVNSDFILDYPEWFYWVKKEDLETYHPPVVEGIKPTTTPKKEYLEQLFESEDVINHLKQFVLNPKDSDPDKWEELLKYHKDHPEMEPLDLVEKFYGLSVAYAFSDHINDPQPAWSDVTYFRLYLDHPVNSQPYLEKLDFEVQPYLLFDVAKASLNPGSIPNEPLWEVLSDIIPYYQKKFGIDGARIDMGHALPNELIQMILSKAKAIDPNFCFIAEELDILNAQISLDKGYNMIIGDGFMNLPFLDEYLINEFVYNARINPSVVYACGETHDTPRLAARDGGKESARMITLLSFFIPNTIPFINSGQEFFEIAPMNLGIGARENEQFLLDEDDPYYGKLALFDYYSFHMTEKDRFVIRDDLAKILPIREKYLDSILDLNKSYPIHFEHMRIRMVGTAFEKEESLLIAVGHTNFYHDDWVTIHLSTLPERFKNNVTIKEVFSTDDHEYATYEINQHNQIDMFVKASEFKLIEIVPNTQETAV